MSAQPDLSKLSVGQFAERFRGEMIPLSNTFSYFCASVPLSEEDVKEYLEEPIAALPPAISALLPKVSIMLVPYLEREEMNARVHGEVDEESWHMKQALLRRETNVRKETKPFRDYVRQSLIDTLTLYLHGICCDIDVETGPRQLPSRH